MNVTTDYLCIVFVNVVNKKTNQRLKVGGLA